MRKSKPTYRIIPADIKYNDPMVTRLINAVMKEGKKSKATDIVYKAIDLASERTKGDGYEVLKNALQQLTTPVEAKRRRVKGANVLVPVEARPRRKKFLAVYWLVLGAKKRTGKSMQACLAAEMIAASQGEGFGMKEKDKTIKMAEANKAFAYLNR